jgi:hypothetical protein
MKRNLLLLGLVLFIFTFLTALSCEKSCYDAEMEANHPGICTQDCPEVCGCDGKTYCNECIANSKGIRIVSEGPCGK